jgi:hypothetical protein
MPWLSPWDSQQNGRSDATQARSHPVSDGISSRSVASFWSHPRPVADMGQAGRGLFGYQEKRISHRPLSPSSEGLPSAPGWSRRIGTYPTLLSRSRRGKGSGHPGHASRFLPFYPLDTPPAFRVVWGDLGDTPVRPGGGDGVKSPGGNGTIEFNPAVAGVATVGGPLG